MHSLHHLELVNALAKYRHFGRAAEELGISQPALSKGLNHLESVLGVKLFDRAAPIAPTAFGDIVLQRSSSAGSCLRGIAARDRTCQGRRIRKLGGRGRDLSF